MEVAKINAKGQATIPKAVRELLKLNEGDRIAFIVEKGNVVIVKANIVVLSTSLKS